MYVFFLLNCTIWQHKRVKPTGWLDLFWILEEGMIIRGKENHAEWKFVASAKLLGKNECSKLVNKHEQLKKSYMVASEGLCKKFLWQKKWKVFKKAKIITDDNGMDSGKVFK